MRASALEGVCSSLAAGTAHLCSPRAPSRLHWFNTTHDVDDVDEDEREAYDTEDELWATEVLAEMAEDLLSRLPGEAFPSNDDNPEGTVRPDVVEMLCYYVEGMHLQ